VAKATVAGADISEFATLLFSCLPLAAEGQENYLIT
jgi:hypothetical protein